VVVADRSFGRFEAVVARLPFPQQVRARAENLLQLAAGDRRLGYDAGHGEGIIGGAY
jgi:hypothetical protein